MALDLPPAWYPACWSRELDRGPLARVVAELPLALFRDDAGGAAALVDRCPHRGYPLAVGRVDGGDLRCGYHGWRFAADGECVEVPCRPGAPAHPTRRAASRPCHERDGLVWTWSGEGTPTAAPPSLPPPDDARYATLRHGATLPAGLQAALENILDVPHTAFLHGGLFRGQRQPVAITAEVRRTADAVEAHYLGEPPPRGLAARLLAPGAETLQHVDRFRLPAIAEVDYRAGAHGRLVVTSALCPETSDRTRLYATIRLRARWPARPLLWLAAPVFWLILRQDVRALGRLTANAKRFPQGRATSTEIDVLGLEIARLLRRAPADDEVTKTIRLLV